MGVYVQVLWVGVDEQHLGGGHDRVQHGSRGPEGWQLFRWGVWHSVYSQAWSQGGLALWDGKVSSGIWQEVGTKNIQHAYKLCLMYAPFPEIFFFFLISFHSLLTFCPNCRYGEVRYGQMSLGVVRGRWVLKVVVTKDILDYEYIKPTYI